MFCYSCFCMHVICMWIYIVEGIQAPLGLLFPRIETWVGALLAWHTSYAPFVINKSWYNDHGFTHTCGSINILTIDFTLHHFFLLMNNENHCSKMEGAAQPVRALLQKQSILFSGTSAFKSLLELLFSVHEHYLADRMHLFVVRVACFCYTLLLFRLTSNAQIQIHALLI